MRTRKKIKVLVVDDSLLFRESLARGIAADPIIEVVATAADPYEARDKILEFEPDVMTLDVEMPKMNGIEFLRRLMPQYPLPVVVVSGTDGVVFDAIGAGAIDFVAKPDSGRNLGMEALINELVVKIKIASIVKVGNMKAPGMGRKIIGAGAGNGKNKIIAIGASTGGTEAIYNILKPLPLEMPGILVVQHMPPVFTKLYAERLNNSCRMEVLEAKNMDRVLPGRVLIAPGDSHMRLKIIENDYYVECFKGEKVKGHRPSIDILFESVAQCMGGDSIGIILTGMGYDGAKGLLSMKKKGAATIGQDEKTSVVYGMPKAAYDVGAVEYQLPLEEIPNRVYKMMTGR
ncbi:MAG: chemotaxis response regulator protein-glutamate methylesterase [Clostridiales bacterium]|nr:chemotaxis response regulator protein-glutamate methylesterase [Clostridiales bacterium]